MKKTKPTPYPNVKLTLEKVIDLLMDNPNVFSYKYRVLLVDIHLLFMRLHTNEQLLYRYLTNLINLYCDDKLIIAPHKLEGLYMSEMLSQMSLVSIDLLGDIRSLIFEMRQLNWLGAKPCTNPHFIRMYNLYLYGATDARIYPNVALKYYPNSDTHYQSVRYIDLWKHVY